VRCRRLRSSVLLLDAAGLALFAVSGDRLTGPPTRPPRWRACSQDATGGGLVQGKLGGRRAPRALPVTQD